MGKINLEDLKPGLVLEADLVSSQGRILLGKGCALESKNLWPTIGA